MLFRLKIEREPNRVMLGHDDRLMQNGMRGSRRIRGYFALRYAVFFDAIFPGFQFSFFLFHLLAQISELLVRGLKFLRDLGYSLSYEARFLCSQYHHPKIIPSLRQRLGANVAAEIFTFKIYELNCFVGTVEGDF